MKLSPKFVQPIEEWTKWRNDFPVDEAQDRFVSRREMVKFLVLTSGAFVFGQAWIGLLNMQRKWTGAYKIKKIARVDELPVLGSMVFSYPELKDTCLLMRISENNYLAYSNKCTHLLCPVIPKLETSKLYCPCHQGYFDLQTGNPIAGPPKRPLPRIELKIMGNDIYAMGIRG